MKKQVQKWGAKAEQEAPPGFLRPSARLCGACTVCPNHTVHDKNRLQLLNLHSQTTCGAVSLIYKNCWSVSSLLVF